MAKAHFNSIVDNLSEYIVRAEKGPDEIRWLYIDAVRSLCDGNVSATARRLGMHRKTLQRIIRANTSSPKPIPQNTIEKEEK
jgi:ActR/RegA family two-component response regulator